MNRIKSNFWEIARSQLLINTGVLLSLIYICSYFYWKNLPQFTGASDSTQPILCWSFFNQCQESILFSSGIAPTLFAILISSSVIALICFLTRRILGLAWFLLFVANMIYSVFYFSDASIATDVGALILLLSWSYLFIPNKPTVFRYVLFLFLIVSSYQHWTIDWLSGATLLNTISLPTKGLEWLAALTMSGYLIFPFLLLSPIAQRRTIGLLGIAAIQIIFFYYDRSFSSISLLIISVFYLFEFFEIKRLERESLYQSYEHPEPSKLGPIIVSLFFLAAQTKAFGHKAIFELVKIQGPAKSVQCQRITFLYSNNDITEISDDGPVAANPALACHSWLNFNYVRNLCHKYSAQPGFKTISHHFLIRNLGDKTYQTQFADNDFCRADLTISKAFGGAQ